MKSVILSGISALALAMTATPAAAQAVIGGGIAGNLGNWNTSGNVTYSSGSLGADLTASVDRTLNSSSVSGFAGNISLDSNACGCVDYAVFGGIGKAGSQITANVDLLGNGTVSTSSFNAGLYGGLANGTATLDVDFANAGQSSFTSTIAYDFATTFDVDFQQLSWEGSGQGSGFGGALAGGAQF